MMELNEGRAGLKRNPITYARHRREVFWQITFPLLIGAGFFLALGVLAGVLGGAGDHSRWADISLIWLILLTLIGSFFFLIVAVGLTFGVIRLIQVLPGGFRQAQDFFVMIRVRVEGLGNKVVEPLLRVRIWSASADRLKHEFGGKLKRDEHGGERSRDE